MKKHASVFSRFPMTRERDREKEACHIKQKHLKWRMRQEGIDLKREEQEEKIDNKECRQESGIIHTPVLLLQMPVTSFPNQMPCFCWRRFPFVLIIPFELLLLSLSMSGLQLLLLFPRQDFCYLINKVHDSNEDLSHHWVCARLEKSFSFRSNTQLTTHWFLSLKAMTEKVERVHHFHFKTRTLCKERHQETCLMKDKL